MNFRIFFICASYAFVATRAVADPVGQEAKTISILVKFKEQTMAPDIIFKTLATMTTQSSRVVNNIYCFADTSINYVLSGDQSGDANSLGIVSLNVTSNCRETGVAVLDSFEKNPLLEIYSDVPVNPWPAVTGSN